MSPDSAQFSLPHVVILGAGFGGMNAAFKLRHAQCRVTIIDRSNHHLFQPLLYQVATAGLSPGEIAAPIRHILRGKNIEVLMAEVQGVDTEKKRVLLEANRTVEYDYLIVATGSRHSYFGHNEWEEFAPGLKSIADATKIRKQLLCAYEEAELETDANRRTELLTVVIIGAGPTGVEMAGSIAELAKKGLHREFQNFNPERTRVILIEAGSRVLAPFPESLSESAAKELQTLGVEIRVNSRVQSVTNNEVSLDGEHIRAATIIWAAGVQASRAAKWLNVDTNDKAGRVPVDKFLNIAGHPEIFVIGDTALALDKDGKPLPGVAPVAIQQGKYVGKRITGMLQGKAQDKAFHYFDKGLLAAIGRTYAVAHVGKLKISGWPAWLVWVFVHIAYLIGFRNRVLVLTEWAWAYTTYQRGVRLIVEQKE